MMNRFEIKKDIIALIDENLYNDVDIAPIIEKHTAEKEINEQSQARVIIQTILRELKEEGDIVFSTGNLSITGRTGNDFFNNSAYIRSTMKYEKEKSKEQENKSHSFNIGGDFAGNINTGNVAGNLHQESNSSLVIHPEDEAKLKSYGISKEEIDALKAIVKDKSNNKSELVSKSMKWLGSVTAAIAGRGIYDNIPAITEFVQRLIS